MGTQSVAGLRRKSRIKQWCMAVLAIGAAAALGVASAAPAQASDPTVTYTGQGFTDGELKSEHCGEDADDGGTGQGVDPAQGYLLWVLTLNADPNDGVKLHLPDGEVDMIKVGGTWKYVSGYYDVGTLTGFPAHATFNASVRGNVQLVVSHGCPGEDEDEGAWCSPGYWKNASDASWALTGYSKNDLFNNTVVPSFYDTASAADPTLIQVLETPGANTFGAASGPYGLNAFNATGAFLTDQIPGFTFDPALVDTDSCPIDNHGNFKE